MTDRRVFLRGVAVAALAAPCVAEAQRPPTIRRIGLLAPIAERTIGAPFFQQLLGTWISFAEEGVLMAYSPSLADQFRRAAV